MSDVDRQRSEVRKHGPGTARSGEAAARERLALGRAADSGGEAAAGRRLVIPQLTLPPTTTDARRQRREAAALAQLLIADLCADMPEAARIIQCGRASCNSQGVVVKRSVDGYVYASGVVTCGSPWACFRCSYKIRAKRARHIGHRRQPPILTAGGGVLFGTFTMSHDRGERLDMPCGTSSAEDGRYVTSGRQWVGFKADVRADRLDQSPSRSPTAPTAGIPHLHVLFFIDAPAERLRQGRPTIEAFRRSLRERWINWLRHQTRPQRQPRVRDPLRSREARRDRTRSAIYCTKVGYELAMADSKIGRNEGQRHPFAIARRRRQLRRQGRRDAAAGMGRRQSKRKRSIHWSGADIKAYVSSRR